TICPSFFPGCRFIRGVLQIPQLLVSPLITHIRTMGRFSNGYLKQPHKSVCQRPRSRTGPLEALLDLTLAHTDSLRGFRGFG
ncbi:mCG1047209, partial [Mus musculus]